MSLVSLGLTLLLYNTHRLRWIGSPAGTFVPDLFTLRWGCSKDTS